jgi:hypothetical protein
MRKALEKTPAERKMFHDTALHVPLERDRFAGKKLSI